MSHSDTRYPLLLGAMMVIAFPAYSQQPTSSAAPAGPSAETLAKAKSLGLKAEVIKGVTQYCYQDASIGSRFTTKKCAGEGQLNQVIEQREALKAYLRSGGLTGTSGK